MDYTPGLFSAIRRVRGMFCLRRAGKNFHSCILALPVWVVANAEQLDRGEGSWLAPVDNCLSDLRRQKRNPDEPMRALRDTVMSLYECQSASNRDPRSAPNRDPLGDCAIR